LPLEERGRMTKEEILENERKCQDYWDEHGAEALGKCKGCDYWEPESYIEQDDIPWCRLAHGAYRDEDCHLCPGIQQQT